MSIEFDGPTNNDNRKKFLAPLVAAGAKKLLADPIDLACYSRNNKRYKISASKDQDETQVELNFAIEGDGDWKSLKKFTILLDPNNNEKIAIGSCLGKWLRIGSASPVEPEEETDEPLRAPIDSIAIKRMRWQEARPLRNENWFKNLNLAWFPENTRDGELTIDDNFVDYWPIYVNENNEWWTARGFPTGFRYLENEDGGYFLDSENVTEDEKISWAKGFLAVAALRLLNLYYISDQQLRNDYDPNVEVSLSRAKIKKLCEENKDDQGQPDQLTFARAMPESW